MIFPKVQSRLQKGWWYNSDNMYRIRYRRILFFFALTLINFAWWDILLSRFGFRRLAKRTRAERFHRAAARFRLLAIDMGGVMIKLGQFLSSRLDVLPREITDELSGLQDEVQPESMADIRRVIEDEFQCPLEDKFTDFEETPMASASIGQVHRAHLCTRETTSAEGNIEKSLEDVVVKIQRPHIDQIVEVDLAALKIVSRWLHKYKPIRKHANVPAILEELDHSIHEEMDYLLEGKHAETFTANFELRKDVCIPQVQWSHTTRRVLTLENVEGIKITDYSALDAAGIDRAEVADRLFDTYLKQIFEDRFFHADPHPGNLFVLPQGKGENGVVRWQLIFVDFGMTGNIANEALEGLREVLIAIGLQDTSRLIHGYQKLHILLPGADLELLEKASGRVFERFWGKTTPEMMNMHQTEAAAFVQEFGDLLYEMPFQVPENFVLLARCMGILSGMCTGLYADFNWWTSLGPYAEKLVAAETSGKGLQFWLKEIGSILITLAGLPKKTELLIQRIEQGKLDVRSPEVLNKITHLERATSRLVGAVIFGVFLLGAVNSYLADELTLSYVLGAAALPVLLWILLKK
jgi:predicted unusual protein kinase regulating ubiquinone biosynthesis (AarF/ABC1/UbiB family)